MKYLGLLIVIFVFKYLENGPTKIKNIQKIILISILCCYRPFLVHIEIMYINKLFIVFILKIILMDKETNKNNKETKKTRIK